MTIQIIKVKAQCVMIVKYIFLGGKAMARKYKIIKCKIVEELDEAFSTHIEARMKAKTLEENDEEHFYRVKMT